jgi:thymidylate synthase ThyX
MTMGYMAKVVEDSIADGVRLTTVEATFPRFILAELNTHRMLSKNSASSRAIPVKKRIEAVRADPFIPESFGRNKPGMQAGEALDDAEASMASATWAEAMKNALAAAESLSELGVHKQLANRLLEPFAFHTAVISGTDWENFFALRISSLAQPEFRKIAEMIEAAMAASAPTQHVWHLPYVTQDDWNELDDDESRVATLVKVSTARCARVSYLTHDGKRDIAADVELHRKLLTSRHMSPFEHVACSSSIPRPTPHIGNFRAPWFQYRKMLRGEAVAVRESA